jgi:putative ABC transport system permease protein
VSAAGPGRRAVVRWAWRLFRREWRQQLLMLALVTVAVAAAVTLAAMAVNGTSQSKGEFGDAAAIVRVDGRDGVVAQASVATAQRRFGQVEVIAHSPVAVPGSTTPLDVRAQDPQGRYGRPMLRLRQGRYPAAADEVALTKGAAELLAAPLGGHVDLARTGWTVVGIVENPSDLRDDFALVAPGALAHPDTLSVLVGSFRVGGGPPAAPAEGTSDTPLQIMGHGDEKRGVAVAVLMATTLAMSLVCLVAAAGFVVVAQRRQRQLGLLGALGATERHLRLVMLANGAIVGATAAVVGGALGVLAWVVAAPAVEAAARHRIGRLDLPWGLVADTLVISVLASTAAAWWPARMMARLPVVAALSGRPARPSPVHRSSALAAVLLAGGAGAIVAARPTADVRPLVLVAGILAVVVGIVFAAPVAIRALAVPARRLPFAVRLALRDLVRYQARAAAALAAITLVTGIAVAVDVVAKANEYRSDEGNLSDHQLLVHLAGLRATSPDPVSSAADRAALDAAAAAVAAAVGSPNLLRLDLAVNPSATRGGADREPVAIGTPIPNGFRGVGVPFVATPQLLERYGIDPSTIEPGTELLTSLPGVLRLLDFSGRPDPGVQTHVQRVGLPSYTSAPTALITESAMRSHGWIPVPSAWLVESTKPLTAGQRAAARTAAAAGGLAVETRSQQDDLATLRTVGTTVGALLALAIVAMTIGLIRSEAARDLRTLTATGAAARTRRALTASTAGALALLGVVLSTVGAYVALAAGYSADLGKLASPPVVNLLLLGLGLPLVATTAGWLLAGREPRTFARQALD